MFLRQIKSLFTWLYLASFHVVLAVSVCIIAFFKLPDGHAPINWWLVLLTSNSAWIIYILDRIIDNFSAETQNTNRHIFHQKHQYTLQTAVVSLVIINISVLFFVSFEIIKLGIVALLLVGFYFLIVQKTKKGKYYKEFMMPIVFCVAICGVPFTNSSSINLSSWYLAFMFFLIVIQNLLAFSYFENIENPEIENVTNVILPQKVRKYIFRLSGIIIFISIIFFTGGIEYSNKMALILASISILVSIIVSNPKYFSLNERYRWVIDFTLFLFLLIF